MRPPFIIACATLMLLSACQSSDASLQDARDTVVVDTSSTPYQFADVIFADGALALIGKHAANIPVAILRGKTGQMIVTRTTQSGVTEDDMEGPVEVTRLADSIPPDTMFSDRVAVLHYGGQSYIVVPMDTIRDPAIVDSLKTLLITSGALKRLYTQSSESRRFDAYARRLFAKATKKTPIVVRLQVPDISAYLVAVPSDSAYAPDSDSDPSMVVVNGKAYPAAAPCGYVDPPFRLGRRVFMREQSYLCFTDVGARSLLEIRADGVRVDPTF